MLLHLFYSALALLAGALGMHLLTLMSPAVAYLTICGFMALGIAIISYIPKKGTK